MKPVLPAAFLFLSAGLFAAEPSALLQDAAAAYRSGRLFEALRLAADALEADPRNAAAKNHVWVITRMIQKKQLPAPLRPGELDRALGLAEKDLEKRRRRAREIVVALESARRGTASVRSPSDVLEGVSGIFPFLGEDLSADLEEEQARAYGREILANLQAALQGGIFASTKDHLRAEGYAAYLRGDWPEAYELWSRALQQDPADQKLARETAALKDVLDRRDRAEKIDGLTRQARIHFKAGDWKAAADAWGRVMALDPANADARAGIAAARVAAEKQALRRKLKARTAEGLKRYEAGDAFGAAQVWLEVLQTDPTFEEARAWLRHVGRSLKTRSRPSAAPAAAPAPAETTSATAPTQQEDKKKAEALYRSGVLAYAEDRIEEAVDLWKKALQIDPQYVQARQALDQTMWELGDSK